MNDKKGPRLPNLEPYYAAGIDPRTGLPKKFGGTDTYLKSGIKSIISTVDRQDAINRYTWYNLPRGLTSQMMERILYYKGQAAFFKLKDQYYFLPYALNGTIDIYGRYTDITPVPFATGKSDDGKEGKPWIQGLVRHVYYDVVPPDELDLDVYDNFAVIIHDYSHGIGQTITPRAMINDCVVDVESEMIPFMRTAILNATGIEGMRVQSEDESAQVYLASQAVNNAALTGQKYVPIVGMQEFQELANGAMMKAEEFMQAQESIDNFRLSSLGISNGGLFQKKAHMLQTEQSAAGGAVNSVLQDGLTIRQNAANIINSITGLGVWCEVSDAVTANDNDMDGMMYDTYDQSGTEKTEPINGGASDDTI